MNEVATFGSWLKRRRKELGLTRPELAQRVTCSIETIDKIEASNRRPSEQVAQLLAECLDIPPKERAQFVEFARAQLPPEQIAQLSHSDAPAPWLAFHRLQHPNNLPASPNSFIGRAREIEVCRAILRRPEVRLLTLTGPPGVGKTRLGLRLAAELIGDFPDGVFFVPLAPISDPELVVPTIARTLRVREGARSPLLESLQAHLRDRQMLLLLDNFEQVIEAAPLVCELLGAAPRLKVLCTSRVVPHLYGEHDFEVLPLALPRTPGMPGVPGPAQPLLPLLPPIENLAQYEAVHLFVERAQAAKSDFAITDENAPTIVEICHCLDGLPLAIELAASRIKLLSPQAILSMLQSKVRLKLDLLTGGASDLSSRQQTMRAAIEWGYDLLGDGEKALFRRLSVFVGGCTLEGAQGVCSSGAVVAVPGSNVDMIEGWEIDVLDLLGRLIDNSLLRGVAMREGTRGEGELRYWILETIREYGLEQLEESGEAEAIRQRHANFYLALVEQAEPRLRGPGSAAWLERLEMEHGDLRAALRWALESEHADIGLRMSGALWRFWYQRGHFSEGRAWLASFLSHAQIPAATNAHADLGDHRGKSIGQKGEAQQRREALAMQGIKGIQETEWTPPLAEALLGAGTLAWRQGDFAAARSYLEGSLSICRYLEDKQGSANALNALASVADGQNEHATARALYGQSLALRRELGDKGGIACSLANLGEVARGQGDFTVARSFYEESLAIRRELGDRNAASMLLHNLGQIALHVGDLRQATVLFTQSLEIARKRGNKQGIIECLTGLAGLAAAKECPAQAARLYGAVESLRKATGSVFTTADRIECERNLATARTQLDQATWQQAWEEGLVMAVEQAIALATASLLDAEKIAAPHF